MSRIHWFSGITTIFLCTFISSADSSNSESALTLCDSAAHTAAQEFDMPVNVLLAIARTETGRYGPQGFNPWPWAVNMEGAGYWFSSYTEALNFTLDRHQGGAFSFDLGCFQINYRWHGKFFGSIEEMFDPLLNARYAAQFLSQLHTEFGSWSAAAGAFHSRTLSKSEAYTKRFDKIRSDLNNSPPKPTTTPHGIFARRGVLSGATFLSTPLATGSSSKLGSLFPHTPASRDNQRIVDMSKQDSN
jgi:hypothetical protein